MQEDRLPYGTSRTDVFFRAETQLEVAMGVQLDRRTRTCRYGHIGVRPARKRAAVIGVTTTHAMAKHGVWVRIQGPVDMQFTERETPCD